MLDELDLPAGLRGLSGPALRALAAEIRERLVRTVTDTGGHLGPNLGVVELTIALHRVFTSGPDRIVFDTGHQAYVHKMLTGRTRLLPTLRRRGGLSGYPNRAESAHDLVENSHASTALSYADGLAKAVELRGERRHVVAVVGDGALTGGMSWEALNNLAAAPRRPVVVVLNDNRRSYAPTVGGLADHLAALEDRPQTGPDGGAGSVFEHLGLDFLGPVDGHDLGALEAVLTRARDSGRTVVVHCRTRKGAGHPAAEADELDSYHSVRGLDAAGCRPAAPDETWTSVFGRAMLEVAASRPDVVAVTAAMLEPTGLLPFARAYPDRVFDVGIAEQHAVASAAGLAMGGLHPVVAVYATFLNRAFDQVLLDAALHRLPVTLVLDRAGVTGPDGPSHHGMWDLALLQLVPGLCLAAPRDANRLSEQLGEALKVDDGVTVVRFPTGRAGADIPRVRTAGGMDVLRDGAPGPDVLLVAVGSTAALCLEAADRASAHGVRDVMVVDPRWVWPVDPVLAELAAGARAVVTVEDGVRHHGIGSAVARALVDAGVDTPVTTLGLPTQFLPHGGRAQLLAEHGISAEALTRSVLAVARGRAGRQR